MVFLYAAFATRGCENVVLLHCFQQASHLSPPLEGVIFSDGTHLNITKGKKGNGTKAGHLDGRHFFHRIQFDTVTGDQSQHIQIQQRRSRIASAKCTAGITSMRGSRVREDACLFPRRRR